MPALILDLFGTLIDGRSDALAHEELSKHLSVVHEGVFTPEEHLRLYHELVEGEGLGSTEAVWRALAELSRLKGFELRLSREEVEELHLTYHGRHAIVFSDVEEALKKAKKYFQGVALVSDADARVARALLEHTGLSIHFNTVVTSGELGIRKPNPQLFLEAARRLRADPANCAVIGDSWKDIEGSKKAGMKAILITRSKPSEWKTTYEPDAQANNLIEAVEKATQLLRLPNPE